MSVLFSVSNLEKLFFYVPQFNSFFFIVGNHMYLKFLCDFHLTVFFILLNPDGNPNRALINLVYPVISVQSSSNISENLQCLCCLCYIAGNNTCRASYLSFTRIYTVVPNPPQHFWFYRIRIQGRSHILLMLYLRLFFSSVTMMFKAYLIYSSFIKTLIREKGSITFYKNTHILNLEW